MPQTPPEPAPGPAKPLGGLSKNPVPDKPPVEEFATDIKVEVLVGG